MSNSLKAGNRYPWRAKSRLFSFVQRTEWVNWANRSCYRSPPGATLKPSRPMFNSTQLCRYLSLCLWALGVALTLSADAAAAPAFRLYTAPAGVTRVAYEELARVGLGGPVASDQVSVWNLGEPVAIWFDDGGDGLFGPGDGFELVAQRLAGEQSYFHPFAARNVYQVRLDRGSGRRMRSLDAVRSAEGLAGGSRLESLAMRRTVHLEEDRLLIRLSGREVKEEGAPDLWYWSKLTHIDNDPFSISLELPSLDLASPAPVRLRAQFRGISRPVRRAGAVPLLDHAVGLELDGSWLGGDSWDGKGVHTVELPPIAPAQLRSSDSLLTIQVPPRVPAGSSDPLVDVVMVNWVEINYPFNGLVSDSAVEIELSASDAQAGGFVPVQAAFDLVAYGAGGSRIEVPAGAGGFEVDGDAGERRWWLVPSGGLRSVHHIELDKPSNLRDTVNQADYLVITHPRLRAAVEPLVEYHRKHGLAVEVVEIQDIFDEFNHGILDPRALRDFISHAYHSWRSPAPRYVLLVGDASWDSKNETVDDANYANWSDRALTRGGQRFKVKTGLPPAGSNNDRNLIPSASFHTPQGHAASDNYFVAVDGDDFYPDLAIGRFPVVEPAEVTAIVDKTLRYMDHPEVGPWRRRVLWITNESRAYQRRSDKFASLLGERGFSSSKVYPSPEEADNAEHQETLIRAFGEGQLLVHFLGHGGRLIWRTGPPDIRKNHDLFTLEHLDRLPPSDRLPVILSMTCHSGPFDHPSADSIGEKFIRLKGRGAIAVVAASWRNGPAPMLSEALVRELSKPGRIGDAFRQAKQGQRELLVEIYNLFGDPAVPIATPGHRVALERLPNGQVRATVDLPNFSGRALVEWVADDEVVESREMAVTASTFEVPRSAALVADWLRVYVWNQEVGTDGLGALNLEETAE